MLRFSFIRNRSRHAETSMQKVKQKEKRPPKQPPSPSLGGVQNGNDHIIPPKKETAADNTRRSRPCCKHEHDFADLSLQIRAQLYTRKRKSRAVRAALPKTHPKITRHKERRIKTIICSLFPLSIEKPPGRLIPRLHMQFPTQPPKRLVDTSKMLAAHAPNPKTRAATTRRGDHTIPA